MTQVPPGPPPHGPPQEGWPPPFSGGPTGTPLMVPVAQPVGWPPPMARLIPPPPRKPLWSHPGLLAALVGSAFVLMLGIGVLLGIVVVTAGKFWMRPGMVVIEVGAILVPALVYALLTKAPWERAFRFGKPIAIGLVLAAVAVTGITFLADLFTDWIATFLPPEQVERAIEAYRPFMECRTPGEWAWAILGVVVAASVTEEILFRGLVQRGLRHRLGRWPAILLTSLAFALCHLNLLGFLVLFALGLLLGWLYERSGSLWPPMAAHAANNLLALWLFNRSDIGTALREGIGVWPIAGYAWVLLLVGVATYALVMPRRVGSRPPRSPTGENRGTA